MCANMEGEIALGKYINGENLWENDKMDHKIENRLRERINFLEAWDTIERVWDFFMVWNN